MFRLRIASLQMCRTEGKHVVMLIGEAFENYPITQMKGTT